MKNLLDTVNPDTINTIESFTDTVEIIYDRDSEILSIFIRDDILKSLDNDKDTTNPLRDMYKLQVCGETIKRSWGRVFYTNYRLADYRQSAYRMPREEISLTMLDKLKTDIKVLLIRHKERLSNSEQTKRYLNP